MVTSNGQRGASAFLVILAMAMAGMASLVLASLISSGLDSGRASERRIQLGALGDAAMAQALASLSADPISTGFARERLGEGWISARIEGTGATRTLVARGEWGDHHVLVDARIRLTAEGPRVEDWGRRLR